MDKEQQTEKLYQCFSDPSIYFGPSLGSDLLSYLPSPKADLSIENEGGGICLKRVGHKKGIGERFTNKTPGKGDTRIGCRIGVMEME